MGARSLSVESSVKMETSQRIIRDPTHECDKCGKTLQYYPHFLEVRKPPNKIRVTKSQNRTQIYSVLQYSYWREHLCFDTGNFLWGSHPTERPTIHLGENLFGRGIHQHPSTTQHPLTHMQQTLYKHNKREHFCKNKAHSTSENSHWRKTIRM